MTTLEAIRASIEHWEKDILAPLEAGRTIQNIANTPQWEDNGTIVPISKISCALCVFFMEHGYENICSNCPLEMADKGCIMRMDSPYRVFCKYLDSESARAMIAALKKCERIEMEKENENIP